MSIKSKIRKLLQNVGYDLRPYRKFADPLERRTALYDSYGIDLVLDVGANVGQFAQRMRSLGYKGKMLSYEPLSSAFNALLKVSQVDPLWEARNYALGDIAGKSTINISENSQSSSFNAMLPAHLDTAPESKYVATEEVEIFTLDGIFDESCKNYSNILLKIDAQGYEINVLEGGAKSLKNISTIQIEMSLVQLYENEMLFSEMYGFLEKLGYTMVSIEPGFSDQNTGQLLQADGIFHRYE